MSSGRARDRVARRAALFAASLAYFVYFYAVVLASPAGGCRSRRRSCRWNAASVRGVRAAPQRVRARAGPAWSRAWRGVPAARALGLCVGRQRCCSSRSALLWRPVPGVVWRSRRRAARGAVRRAGCRRLAHAPQRQPDRSRSSWRASGRRAAPAPGRGFEIAGPFRMVRHPIYLGWLLMVFGGAVDDDDAAASSPAISCAYLHPGDSARGAVARRGRTAIGTARISRPVRWRMIAWALRSGRVARLRLGGRRRAPRPRSSLRQAFELLEEHQRVRWDGISKRLPQVLQVTSSSTRMRWSLHLGEHRPVALVGAAGRLRPSSCAASSGCVVVGPAAARALEPCGALLGFLGEELRVRPGHGLDECHPSDTRDRPTPSRLVDDDGGAGTSAGSLQPTDG